MPITNPSADSLIQGVSGQTDNVSQNLDQQYNTTQKVRVISIKYKIYAFVMLLLGIVLYDPAMQAYREYNAVMYEIEQANLAIQRNITKSQQYDKDISLLKIINSNIPELIVCLNTEKNCGDLNEQLKNNLETIRSYLQLNDLSEDKMIVNEKIILKNINEFLAQEDPFDSQRKYNGEVIGITIGDTRDIKEHLKSFDITITMNFDNKDALLKFIQNIESHVFYQQNSQMPLESTLLYKINGMDYDIVNYNKQQEISIELEGFYYTK